MYVALKTERAVDEAWLDSGGSKAIQGSSTEPFCVFVFTPRADGAYSRMFAPEYGIVEDPPREAPPGLSRPS